MGLGESLLLSFNTGTLYPVVELQLPDLYQKFQQYMSVTYYYHEKYFYKLTELLFFCIIVLQLLKDSYGVLLKLVLSIHLPYFGSASLTLYYYTEHAH